MLKIDEEKLIKIKEYGISNNVPIIQDEALNVVKSILNITRPDKILEIGTAIGYSAINFAKYLKDSGSYIKTIEINQDSFLIAKKNIEDVGLEKNIFVIEADATIYLKELKEDNTYDVVFIDAAKGQYLVFLEEAIRLIKNGGVIIADNVLFHGMVRSGYNEHKYRTAVTRLRRYLEIIEEDTRLTSNVIDIGDGLAISRVEK